MSELAWWMVRHLRGQEADIPAEYRPLGIRGINQKIAQGISLAIKEGNEKPVPLHYPPHPPQEQEDYSDLEAIRKQEPVNDLKVVDAKALDGLIDEVVKPDRDWFREYRAVPIGTRIWANRKRLELSQRELAERVGCTQSTISQIEGGTKQPSLPMAEKIMAEMGLDLMGAPPEGFVVEIQGILGVS